MEKKTPLKLYKVDKKGSLQELNLASYQSTNPILFIAGENNIKNVDEAKKITNTGLSLVGLKPNSHNINYTSEQVDVLVCVYGELDNGSHFTAVTKQELSEVVDNLFMPLSVAEGGVKLNTEEALTNFSRINFFTHGYGSLVVNEIVADLGQKMIQCGYSGQEILQLEQQMTCVSYGPYAEIYNMPSLQAISARDGTSMLPNGASDEFRQMYLSALSGQTDFRGNHVFQEDENTVTLFTSNMSKLPTNEHSITLLERNEFGEYTTINGANADAVSQVVSNALTNSLIAGVNGTAKPTAEQMLKNAQEVLSKFEPNEVETVGQY